MTALSIQGLGVKRGAVQAVRDISLDLVAPTFCGVAGANGSGKTSLLRALAGRLSPSHGAIRIDGRDLTADPAARARVFGLAPEAARLPGEVTVERLIAIVAEAQGEGPRPDRLAGVHAALDLPALATRRVDRLSAGQRQRTALYLGLLGDPPILLLDEPFNGLDPVIGADFRAALRALIADRSLICLCALHELTVMALHCEVGIVMADARLARTFDAAALAIARQAPAAFEADVVEILRGA